MKKLDSSLYLHDSDRAALAALKAVPGFSQVTKAFMKIWNEKSFRIINMSTNLKLSENQLSKYYNLLPPICEKLGIEIPELYVELDVNPNAYTYGDTKPFIVITSGLFETLPDELIPTVLAHECGHIACHHTLYTTMGRAVLNGVSNFVKGIGGYAIYPLQLAFAYWMRCSEFSADRAAVICDGVADRTIETCMRLAGLDKDIMAEANVELFMNQAIEYREMVADSAWNKTLEFLYLQDKSHPQTAIRAYEAREWANSERYQAILKYLETDIDNAEELLPVECSPKKYIGHNYLDVQVEIMALGFRDIELKRITEKEKVKDGSVILITVNESTENGWYKRDSKVLIEYFESKTDEEIAMEHPGEILIPESYKNYLGKEYQEVVSEFKDLGFTDIEVREQAMSIIGIGEKVGSVALVSVSGQSKFAKKTWFHSTAHILINYYVKRE